MSDNRAGESGNIPFRAGRVFNVDNDWYFATREGENQGPFENRQEAEAALTLYLRDRALDNESFGE